MLPISHYSEEIRSRGRVRCTQRRALNVTHAAARFVLTTHDAGGVNEKDVAMAKAMEAYASIG